jgi:2-amino-4-hydroxy-6-hydroxymethyldihydropteridine diphosphokinase
VKSETVFLSLGSNLGNRRQNLKQAVLSLQEYLTDLRCSSIYETKPMYVLRQPSFLNKVVAGQCRLQPEELLDGVLAVERALGRDRNKNRPKGPRVIDIDILIFGQRVLSKDRLSVPHPRMKERQFVLIPLLELEPNLRDPETGAPYSESLRVLGDQGVYIFSG